MKRRSWNAMLIVIPVTIGSYFGGGFGIALVGALAATVAVLLVSSVLPRVQKVAERPTMPLSPRLTPVRANPRRRPS